MTDTPPSPALRDMLSAWLAGLRALEDQMRLMTAQGWRGRGSPDRLDALVWALSELIVTPAAVWRRPQMRGL